GTDRLRRTSPATSAQTNMVVNPSGSTCGSAATGKVRLWASTVRAGVQTAVFNPADNYVVAPGAGVIHDGECDSGYGNDPIAE
ncbi:MAG: hypothetical protein M3536_12305, partial [Actinomycetota bacterium]|nr:hypothetical protein [Actinomycetota bacterium]